MKHNFSHTYQKTVLLAVGVAWSIFLAVTWTPTAASTPTPLITPTVTSSASALNFQVTPRQAESYQPITISVEGLPETLPTEVAADQAEACLILRDAQEQEIDSWWLTTETNQTQEIRIRESVAPGLYQLGVEICTLTRGNVVNANPQLEPLATLPITVKPNTGQFDRITTLLSPNGQWTAIVNATAGSLTVADSDKTQTEIFPKNSMVQQALWSPDSERLLVVRTGWQVIGGELAASASEPIELWRLEFDLQSSTVSTPTLLYKPAPSDYDSTSLPQQMVFGSWSPNNRHLLFGVSILSASILADGIPPLVLDTITGQVYPVARPSLPEGMSPLELGRQNTALVNPRYHSWSPDGSTLAITAGGYRSAQTNKWLNLFDVTTGQVTTVISQTEQIPGIVAWSPSGDVIAYAAVPTALTADEWDHWSVFENQAIAGRRIHLLDPATGQHRRLNGLATYQDAPVWSADGARLYYVQRNGETLDLMVADPTTGQTDPVPGASQSIDLQDTTRPMVGYYGQFGRHELLEQIPLTTTQLLEPDETDQSFDCNQAYPGLPNNFQIITNPGEAQLAFKQNGELSEQRVTLIGLTDRNTWIFDEVLPFPSAGWSPSGQHLLLGWPSSPAPIGVMTQPPFWTPSAALPDATDWLALPTIEGALLVQPIPTGSPCQILPPGSLPPSESVLWSDDGWLAWTSEMDAPPLDETLPQTLFLHPVGAKTEPLTWPLSDDIRQTYYRLIDWVPGTRLILAAEGFMGASVWSWGLPLVAIDADTGEITDLETVMPLSREAYAWHPTQPGRLAFIESKSRYRTDESRLALLDVETGETRYLFSADLTAFEPNWSPDGQLLAYAAVPFVPEAQGDGKTLEELLNGRAIYIIDPDSDEIRQVTFPSDDALDGWPQWSEDGTRLVYARRQAGQTDIREVALDTLDDEVIIEDVTGPERCYYGACGWGQWLAYR